MIKNIFIKKLFSPLLKVLSKLEISTTKTLSWLGFYGCSCIILIVFFIIMNISNGYQDFDILVDDDEYISIVNYSNQLLRIFGFSYFMEFTHKTSTIIPAPNMLISGKIKAVDLSEITVELNKNKDKHDKFAEIKSLFVDSKSIYKKLLDSLRMYNFEIEYSSTEIETLTLVPISNIENNLLIISKELTQYYWEFWNDCHIGGLFDFASELSPAIDSERKMSLSFQPKDNVKGVYGPTCASILLDGYEIKKSDSTIASLTKKTLILFEPIPEIENKGTINDYIDYIYFDFKPINPKLKIKVITIPPSSGIWELGKLSIVDRYGELIFEGRCQSLNIHYASGNLILNNKTRDFKLSNLLIGKFIGVVEYIGKNKIESNPVTLIRGKAKTIKINDEEYSLSYYEKVPEIFKWILNSIFVALWGLFIAGKSKKTSNNHINTMD